ncbi:response regulator transcription factor [Salinirussus salinus]|jgi:DNA-binding response OmpR family regulator|uniref:response regulator transcription factor n=1 Tax=Salinirussus salinus TaxID=1198300 RepID=UPI00135900B5|nr:response regulator [Salinirussus salinus]
MTDGEDPVVLVVEDERDLADSFAALLDGDYSVRVAYDARAAVDLYDETVDVALLDRHMPGPSGDEVLQHIRDEPGDCGVGMLTAVDPAPDIADMAFDEYILKPASRNELTSLVESLLRRTTCDEALRRHYRLTNKIALLEEHLEPAELSASEEYQRLQAELADIDRTASEAVAELDSEDVGAILHSDSEP